MAQKPIGKYSNSSMMKFMNACRKDKGQPRFRKVGKEGKSYLDEHKVTAFCWGGYNREPGAESRVFTDVPKPIENLLRDTITPDWKQILQKIDTPLARNLLEYDKTLIYEDIKD